MGGLESIVIVEVHAFDLDMLDSPVNIMGQRRELQGLVSIWIQAQEPLQSIVGMARVLWHPRTCDDQPDFLFSMIEAIHGEAP